MSKVRFRGGGVGVGAAIAGIGRRRWVAVAAGRALALLQRTAPPSTPPRPLRARAEHV